MDTPYDHFHVGEKLWTVPPRQAPADSNPPEMLSSTIHAAANGIGNQ